MGYSPWGHKESDTTQQLTHTHTQTHTLEEPDSPGQTYKFLSFRLFIVNLLKCQLNGKSQRAIFCVYYFIFWLSWVFVALPGFLQLLLWGLLSLIAVVSLAVVHGLSCSLACGIFLDHRSNPCLLDCQASPLSHESKPTKHFLNVFPSLSSEGSAQSTSTDPCLLGEYWPSVRSYEDCLPLMMMTLTRTDIQNPGTQLLPGPAVNSSRWSHTHAGV